MPTKICTKCKKPKDISEFSKDNRNKHGLRSKCKACSKEYRQEHKEEITEHRKQYKKDHKKEIAARDKRYNQKHKEARAAYQKTYRQIHKEERIKYIKKYCKINKIRISNHQKIYRDDNKDKLKLYYQSERFKCAASKARHKRKAFRLNNVYEEFNPCKIFERDNYICQLCGKKTRPDYKNQHHPLYPNLDHIVPLSKGGDHTMKNTQCLCHRCNCKKHNTGIGDQLRLFG